GEPCSNHGELSGLGIEQAGHDRIINAETFEVADVGAPGPSMWNLLANSVLPLLLDKCEVQPGAHLHGPLVVKGADDDVGRVAQVFKGMVCADADLAGFSH